MLMVCSRLIVFATEPYANQNEPLADLPLESICLALSTPWAGAIQSISLGLFEQKTLVLSGIFRQHESIG